VQDYKFEWLEIIKNYFLKPGGEYVLFGDEKQNIYGIQQENKNLKLNIDRRNKTELKSCFRFKGNIRDLALGFQKFVFADKYEPDAIESKISIPFGKGYMKYYFIQRSETVMQLFNYIYAISNELKEHPSDIAALGFSIRLIRKLDCYYRYKTNQKTNGMFESTEIWYKLFLDINASDAKVKSGLCLIPGNKTKEQKRAVLAMAMTLQSLVKEFRDPFFKQQILKFMERNNIAEAALEEWYDKSGIRDLITSSKNSFLLRALKKVRYNKKIHFNPGRDSMNISTVHSFKGWEVNTLFLIIEPVYTDFASSFEEIIYTGLTRSKTNLIILNYGNERYHTQLQKLLT
jgi:hypothetical protein